MNYSVSQLLPERIAPGNHEQANHLPISHDWALFLDVDGTLIELIDSPDAIQATTGLRASIGRLSVALGGALALVSGRRLADLDHIFAPLTLPVAGAHGLERRDARGCTERPAEAVDLDALRAPLRFFTERFPGTQLEDKGGALALHYRRAPEARQAAKDLLSELIAEHPEQLKLLAGKMVFEVKPASVNKGSAIAAFMAEPPFAERTPVFIGDDVTDEDGFATVNELGGHAIYVGRNEHTRAAYRLADVSAVHAWLDGIADALRA